MRFCCTNESFFKLDVQNQAGSQWVELTVLVCCLVSALSDRSQSDISLDWWFHLFCDKQVVFSGLLSRKTQWPEETIPSSLLCRSGQRRSSCSTVTSWGSLCLCSMTTDSNSITLSHAESQCVQNLLRCCSDWDSHCWIMWQLWPNGFIFALVISLTSNQKPGKDEDVTVQLVSLGELKVTNTQNHNHSVWNSTNNDKSPHLVQTDGFLNQNELSRVQHYTTCNEEMSKIKN